MKRARLSKAETRILEQCWKLGTCSVREILESLPEEGRIAYTTVQTLVSGGLRGGVSGGVRNGTAGGVK
jgi:predicted transcriptional regulator